MTNLFEQFGGEQAVILVVKEFYERILTDAELSPFFIGIDLSALQRKQKWFITSILMSSTEGTGSYMERAHRKLVRKKGLNENHFDKAIAHLDMAMQNAKIEQEPREKLIMSAKLLKHAVLGNT